MVIKPRVIKENDDGVIDGPWGPEKKREQFSVNGKLVRRETLTEYLDDESPYLVKECLLGTLDNYTIGSKPSFDVDSYSYSTIDALTGELIQFGNECVWPTADTTHGTHCVFAGEFGKCYPPKLTLSGISVPNPTLSQVKYRTIDDIHARTGYYENEFQIPYMNLVGLLSAFFTKWNYAYPFESFIHIETESKKFWVPKFTYKPGIPQAAGRKLYYSFLKEIDTLCELISATCKTERRNLSINVFTGLYGSVIKIHDLNRARDYILPLNGTEHLQNVMTNIVAHSIDFITSDSLGLLCSGRYSNVTRDSLDACSGLL